MASSLPIGLVVGDGPGRFEAVANGDAGPPLGRELEIARLLRFIRDRRIDNVVWITGDVHYAAAHHYDPARARFTEFTPFWEFVAGPLHAGTFGPNALDPTFGPEVRFLGIPAGHEAQPPAERGPAVLRAPGRRGGHRRAARQPARPRRARDLQRPRWRRRSGAERAAGLSGPGGRGIAMRPPSPPLAPPE